MRVILFGTFNSGSSALASVLHHLGVKMYDVPHGSHFEDKGVMRQLTQFHKSGTEGKEVVEYFKTHFARLGDGVTGIKHPLLPLFAEEVIQAAGGDAKLIWINRSAVRSMRGLLRRRWYPAPEARMLLLTIYGRIVEALWDRDHLEIQFNRLLTEPLAVAPGARRLSRARER